MPHVAELRPAPRVLLAVGAALALLGGCVEPARRVPLAGPAGPAVAPASPTAVVRAGPLPADLPLATTSASLGAGRRD